MKKWSEMTQAEIDKLKREQCVKCKYLSGERNYGLTRQTCDYIGITGRSRGCSPLECQEKGIFKEWDGKRRRQATMTVNF